MDINKIELENLKRIITNQKVSYNKFVNYADYAVDPQIKQIFNQFAKDSMSIIQKLGLFLNNK